MLSPSMWGVIEVDQGNDKHVHHDGAAGRSTSLPEDGAAELGTRLAAARDPIGELHKSLQAATQEATYDSQPTKGDGETADLVGRAMFRYTRQ